MSWTAVRFAESFGRGQHSACELAVLKQLALRTNAHHTCHPTVEYLAAKTGYGVSTCHRAINGLTRAGRIRVFHRWRPRSGGRCSSRYLLLVDGPDTPEPPEQDWAGEYAPIPLAPRVRRDQEEHPAPAAEATAAEASMPLAGAGACLSPGEASQESGVEYSGVNTNLTPQPPAPPAGAVPPAGGTGEGGDSQEIDPLKIKQLCARVRMIRPRWAPSAVEAAIRHPDVLARPWAMVEHAALACAADRAGTRYPGRLRYDGTWWEAAEKATMPPEPEPDTPAPVPAGPRWCGCCNRRTRLISLDQVDGTVDPYLRPMPQVRCPRCHPQRAAVPAG